LPLLIPIVISALLGCITLAVIGLKTNSFSLILAEQAQALKDPNAPTVDLSFWGKLIPLAPIHMAIIWWFAFRLWGAEVSQATRRSMTIVLWIAVLTAIANSIAHAERVTLMPILVGLFPVWVFTNTKVSMGKSWSFLKPIAVGAGAVLGLFFLLTLLRGNAQVGDAAQLLLGYTFSSYNRLAATLDGSLRYTYAGNVQDLCAFCTSNKYLNAVFPYAQFFHIPDAVTTWATDFTDTGSAGLVGGYTFASAFAYIFRDIGWWSPLYFLLQGLIVGRAWQSFERGRVFGLMLYPWCAFSVLFWFGFNVFFNDAFFYIIAGAIVLRLYEKLSFGRAAATQAEAALPRSVDSPATLLEGN